MADQSEQTMSTDATPVSIPVQDDIVAQIHNVGEQSIMDRQIEKDLSVPHEDWKFRHFLVRLAGEITDDDLDKLKMMFSGDGGIGRGVLEKVDTPFKLFTLLEKRCWLNRDNLIRLQSALLTCQRSDLIKTAAEYAQSLDNVLHFNVVTEVTENGDTCVKFHIRGRTYLNTTRNDIQQLRMKFAELLFAPPERIVIAGIEPATSLIITFHIPTLYVGILTDMLAQKVGKSRLLALGVDIIEFPHKKELIHLEDTEVVQSVPSVTQQHQKLHNIYQQLENTKKLLEASETEQLRLEDRLKEFEKESFEREALLKSMKTRFISPDNSDRTAARTDDVKMFEKQLNRPEFESYDKALILSLLDINTRIVSNAVAEGYQLMEEKMKLAIKELESRLRPLQFELMKLRTFSSQVPVDDMILASFRKLAENLSAQRITQEVSINEDFLSILQKISRKLRHSEREKLAKMYTWAVDEPLKRAMDNDYSQCLACILHKEIQRVKALIPAETFIMKCLEDVSREDLKLKFEKLYAQLEQARNAAKMGSKQQKPRSRSLERNDDGEVRLDRDQLQRMSDQIAAMHKIITTAHESTKSPSYVGFPPSSKRFSFESTEDKGFVY